MKHRNEQAMLFYFLDRDYNRPWEEIESDIGYDMGDYCFESITAQQIKYLAKANWVILNGIKFKDKE